MPILDVVTSAISTPRMKVIENNKNITSNKKKNGAHGGHTGSTGVDTRTNGHEFVSPCTTI